MNIDHVEADRRMNLAQVEMTKATRGRGSGRFLVGAKHAVSHEALVEGLFRVGAGGDEIGWVFSRSVVLSLLLEAPGVFLPAFQGGDHVIRDVQGPNARKPCFHKPVARVSQG